MKYEVNVITRFNGKDYLLYPNRWNYITDDIQKALDYFIKLVPLINNVIFDNESYIAVVIAEYGEGEDFHNIARYVIKEYEL